MMTDKAELPTQKQHCFLQASYRGRGRHFSVSFVLHSQDYRDVSWAAELLVSLKLDGPPKIHGFVLH